MDSNSAVYPDSNIDPREKGFNYILQYTRAAYKDAGGYMPSLSHAGRLRFQEIKDYAQGRQSIQKYRKLLNGGELADNDWLTINDEVVPIIPKFREIAISKLLQRNYDLNAFAIDSIARTDEDEYFRQMMVKLMMRDVMRQQGSPLADKVRPEPNEPEDLEELQMEMTYGYKHAKAIEAEDAANLILQQGDLNKQRKKVCESLYDFGLGGYKEWIDENGMVKYRACNIDNIIPSYCVEPDFSDMVHCGEVLEVMLVDLAPYFTPAQLDEIGNSVAGKYGNPTGFVGFGFNNTNARKFKVAVFDFEFFSWNTSVYSQNYDSRDNLRFGRTEFKYIDKVRNVNTPNGEAEPKYKDVTQKVIYKTKWIIGTDFMYDYGLAENMKRKPSSWWDTQLSYHLIAWNFHRMKFSGITERLMPIADNWQLTWLKLQNLKNQLIPYLIDIDLDALENVALGAGGNKMTPMQILDLMFQKNVLVSRRKDISEGNVNYKSVDIRPTGMLDAFVQLYQDLDRNYLLMQQVSGLNELTDGSSPNPKLLTTVANLANQATNNALYLVSDAEKSVLLRLADAVVQKMQIAVKIGKVEGYVRALGSQSVKFVSVSPDISLHEFGIFFEDAPTEEQWQQLYAELNGKEMQGLIEPDDKIMIRTCRNLKKAQDLLAYRVKKRKQEMQQQQLQNQQLTIQGQQQSAMQTAQMQQQLALLQAKLDIEKINVEKQWDYIIQAEKNAAAANDNLVTNHAKLIGQQIMADAKNTMQSS